MMEKELVEIDILTTPPDTPSKSYSFGWFTFRRLGKILRIIFSQRSSVVFLSLICLMALLEQYLVYNVGIIPSGFYKVLGDKDIKAFWLQVLKSCLLISAICSVISSKKYILNVFYVSSREILTDKLHVMYFKDAKFYILNTLKYAITDNPDQRITQDIDKFCKQFSTILGPFVIAPFTISYYSYICYQTTGWVGPVSVFCIFLFSAIGNKLLIQPIMDLVIQQEKLEGNFRFKHMHVRTHAESIAFQDAQIAEMSRSGYKLLDLINVQQSLYLRELPLDLTVNIFSYAGSIVSYLILAYPIFAGNFDNLSPSDLSALISKNAFVAIFLISSFSSLINISTTISEIGGLTHRVCEILEALKVEHPLFRISFEDSLIPLTNKLTDEVKQAFELQNVSFSAPGESIFLIKNLSLKINLGTNLLISGNSSSGKTSLFRVIKGLWPILDGTIIRNLPFQPSHVFFLPQQPLLSDGSLIEQIVYPLELPMNMKPKDNDVHNIIKYIEYVDLEHILVKCGLFKKMGWNWYDILSPGEAQRLSFVRLFCHKPRLAFLDEATSALNVEMEEKLYQKCEELGITVISIGHRSSLVKFHSLFLHLNGEGGWAVSDQPYSDGPHYTELTQF